MNLAERWAAFVARGGAASVAPPCASDDLPEGWARCAGVLARERSFPVQPPDGYWAERLAGVDLGPLEGWRFLDLETSGLRGRPFLAGIGRFAGDAVLVRLLALQEPANEPEWLEAPRRELDGATALVTFNGRSFDVPLLCDRYALTGDRASAALLRSLPHWDLCGLARRAWGGGRLSELQARLLDRGRHDDVPGWMIPGLYTAFLQGDGGSLGLAAEHNAADVAALAGIASFATRQLASGCGCGGLALAAGAHLRAAVAYEREGRRHLAARLFKRAGMWDEAERLWRGLLPSAEAAVELAKLYEHRRKRPELALEVVNLALARSRLSPRWRADLERRRQRLCRAAPIGPRRNARAPTDP